MRRDVLDRLLLIDKGLHPPELVQWMKVHALRVFSETVVLGENGVIRGADAAWDGRILGKPPRLDEQLERAIAPAAGRNFIVAGFLTPGVEDQIGRASCRERRGQYVSISVVAGSLKQK